MWLKRNPQKKKPKKNKKKLTRTKQVSKEKIPQQQGMNSRKQPPFVPPRRSPESTWCQDVIFLVVSIDSSDRLPWQRWSTRSLNTRQIASRPSLRALQDTLLRPRIDSRRVGEGISEDLALIISARSLADLSRLEALWLTVVGRRIFFFF